jgi:hypothetical protein
MSNQITNVSGSWTLLPLLGANTQVLFNDSGSFGGDSGFTYDKTTGTLTAGTIRATSLTGSLTKLSDGSNYLVAGSGISITAGASGALTIAAASPMSASSSGSAIETIESTISASYVDLATAGPSVTLTTNTSVICFINTIVAPTISAGNAYICVAVTGSTVVTASDNPGAYGGGHTTVTTPLATVTYNMSTALLFTGLTPGSNTFTMKYRSSGDATQQFAQRRIFVQTLD